MITWWFAILPARKSATRPPSSSSCGTPSVQRSGGRGSDEEQSKIVVAMTRKPSTFEEEVAAMRERLKRGSGGALREWATRLGRARVWDTLVFATLLFTATVTPMEVAFQKDGVRSKSVASASPESAGMKLLFALNRIVDVVFIVDLLKHALLATMPTSPSSPSSATSSNDNNDKDLTTTGRRAVMADAASTQRRYARNWLPIDVVAAIPYDLVALAANDGRVSRLRALRMLRLVRLLKLGSVGEIIRHFQISYSLSYASLAILKYLAIIIVSAHWMTCLWVLTAALQPKRAYTWVEALADSKNDIGTTDLARRSPRTNFRRHSVSHRYARGLYFTVYTLTGLGLGDVVPSTQTETIIATLLIAYGGIIWAYIVGNVCSVVTTMDVHGIAFRQRMDELNYMLKDRNFSTDLRERCRLYFHQSKQQHRVAASAHLVKLMSAGLRAEVAAAANGEWLQQVWYLRNASHAFVAEISVVLSAYTFAPAELVDVGPPTLFILRKGIAARRGRILGKGSVWGADFVIADSEASRLIEPVVAVALTYVDTITLSKDDLEFVLVDFPAEAQRIHQAMRWYVVRNVLQARGRELLKDKPGDTRARSVIGRVSAQRPLYRERSRLAAAGADAGWSRPSDRRGGCPMKLSSVQESSGGSAAAIPPPPVVVRRSTIPAKTSDDDEGTHYCPHCHRPLLSSASGSIHAATAHRRPSSQQHDISSPEQHEHRHSVGPRGVTKRTTHSPPPLLG